ncbi:class I SAM-dependent methyltransferase [Prosthecobacter sp.]|uniref:class I SAM-dependent methyltransferase n=1 Tax=Prosthecobacter sp. TaxID=1965333 RepID=UPI0037848430
MMSRFKIWLERQRFLPSRAGIFVNRDFIIRRGLMREVGRFAKQFKGRILDFGCGEKPYESLFSVEKYVGVDIEVSGHSSEKKKADFYFRDTTLPFADAEFDGALSTEVFQSVPDPGAMLRELARVLKPGAPLLITYPYGWEEVEMPYDMARYTSVGLNRFLNAAGFDVEEVVKTPTYIETLTQLFTLWLSRTVLPWGRRAVRIVSTTLFVAPINLFGIMLGRVLPNDPRYFHNVILLARKRQVLNPPS